MSYDITDPAIVPATDDQGHSAKVTVRLPPDWLRQMDLVVKHSGLGYCNRGDLVRDAVRRHFQWIEDWLKEKDEELFGSLWSRIRLILDEQEQDRYQQGFGLVVSSLRERVNMFLSHGANHEAIRHVLRTIQIINQMPDNYWKTVHLAAVLGEYKNLLATSKKVKLVDTLSIELNEDEDEDEDENENEDEDKNKEVEGESL